MNIKRYIKDQDYRFLINASLGIWNRIDDKKFIERKYRACMEQDLTVENVKTFNEKLQWLKLYDRKKAYTVMVDKYRVRDYVAEKIGENYLIPLLGVWDSPEEIDFKGLPNQFVIKCNHNSGLGMCICTDKLKLDLRKVRRGLAKGLKQDYYLTGREWPYKDVPRKIIAEKFLQSDEGGLTDYKVHCFNGKPKFVLVCRDRFVESGLTEDFYTIEWEHMEIKRPKVANAATAIPKPKKLNEMLRLAEDLSKDIPFLRVDFYIVDEKIYFSELTFFPASGFEKFEPEIWNKKFGAWLQLPEVSTCK